MTQRRRGGREANFVHDSKFSMNRRTLRREGGAGGEETVNPNDPQKGKDNEKQKTKTRQAQAFLRRHRKKQRKNTLSGE